MQRALVGMSTGCCMEINLTIHYIKKKKKNAKGANAFIYQAGDTYTQAGEVKGSRTIFSQCLIACTSASSVVWCLDPMFVSVSDLRADHTH